MYQTAGKSTYVVQYKSGLTCDNCGKKGHKLFDFGSKGYHNAYDRLCPDCLKKTLSDRRKGVRVDDRILRQAFKVDPIVLEMNNELYAYVASVRRMLIACIQFGKGSYRESIIQYLHNGNQGLLDTIQQLTYLLTTTNNELGELLQSAGKVDLAKYAPKQTFMYNKGYGVLYVDSKAYKDEAVVEFFKALLDEVRGIQEDVMSNNPGSLNILCPSCGSYLVQKSVIRTDDSGERYARYGCVKKGCKCENNHLVYSMGKIRYF